MKVYRVRGYPDNQYFVHGKYWKDMVDWMMRNQVGYIHMTSNQHGFGFIIKTNFDWFSLRWL